MNPRDFPAFVLSVGEPTHLGDLMAYARALTKYTRDVNRQPLDEIGSGIFGGTKLKRKE